MIAYQIRQAFKPGEITPEQANEIGYDLAMKFTRGKHAFIVTTHTDKHHIHNHVVFNSVSIDGKSRFRNFYFSGMALGRISDTLCIENNLSVIQSRYEERLKGKNSKHKWKDKNPDSLKFLVDVEKKMQEGKGKGYERWARKFNLKQRAKVLLFLEEHEISSYEELVKITDGMKPKLDELNDRIKKRQAQMADNKNMQKAVITYAKTKEIYARYKASGYSRDYYKEHEDAIKEHEWARDIYKMHADGEPPKMKDLRDEYGKLLSENKADFTEYVKLKKETRDYLVARKNLELLLAEKEAEEKEKAKAQPSKNSRSETSL